MWQTPAMRQYVRFKTAHPDCLLMFRMGDFYELFDQDAVTAHEVLGITLTERTKGMSMAGVPYHSMEGYLRRLVERGFRVAICDQIQDPKDAKGVVDRAVTRVLTPGTLVDESLLDDASSNHVAAVHLSDDRALIATAELSTGAFDLHDVPQGRLHDELARIAPANSSFRRWKAPPPGSSTWRRRDRSRSLAGRNGHSPGNTARGCSRAFTKSLLSKGSVWTESTPPRKPPERCFST